MDSVQYQKFSDEGFAGIDTFPACELRALLEINLKKIEFHREERKMHFGALALVSLLFFLLLPVLDRGGTLFFHASLIAILLLCLIVPYIRVYFKYENTLRKMNMDYFKILDALSKKDGTPP